MVSMKIPRKFQESSTITNSVLELMDKTPLEYEVSDGEVIDVTDWFRYPSYDMIFGTPAKDSPRAEKEIMCFVVRYATEKSYATYFDSQELGDVLNALVKIYAKVRIKK